MTFRERLARWLAPHAFSSVTARVNDDPGWSSLSSTVTAYDRASTELQRLQTDALTAWRENPLARGIVNLTTNFVVGDGISLSSSYAPLDHFISEFWNHPENRLDLRLHEMCDELTRSGELFPVLIHAADGMSYVRLKPASSIDRLEWRPGDYEHETRYHELTETLEGKWWPAWNNVQTGVAPAPDDAAIMLHYAVNRPIGCTRGESDLAPIIEWLRRYSGWLEDRARLNWAARVFLWFVTVPTNQVSEKRSQYRNTPEPGSIIVKDSGENWEMKAPQLHATDAEKDGQAFRYMIAAGAGTPLHMLGEADEANLATATAMRVPVMRQYRRRQLYFCYMLADMTAKAFNYHVAITGASRRFATANMIAARVPELDEEDNNAQATASREIVSMLSALRAELQQAGIEPTADLNRRTVELAFRFAGEIITPEEITTILGMEP